MMFCVTRIVVWLLFSLLFTQTTEGKRRDHIELCLTKEISLVPCGESKKRAVCVGALAGDLKTCTSFDGDSFVVPICFETSTNYVSTCGAVGMYYLCFSRTKGNNAIRPCDDIRRRVCYINSYLRHCKTSNLRRHYRAKSIPTVTQTSSTTTASGSTSTALGSTSSTASGSTSTASGSTSTALGSTSTASGSTSTAPSSTSTASGITSTASGTTSTASGTTSTASGSTSTETAISSTLMTVPSNSHLTTTSKTFREKFFIFMCHNCSIQSEVEFMDKSRGKGYTLSKLTFPP